MRIRSLAIVCVAGGFLGLAVLVALAFHTLRSYDRSVLELQQIADLEDRLAQLGVALDYALLVQGGLPILSAVREEALSLRDDVERLGHPQARRAARHLEEVAQIVGTAAELGSRMDDTDREGELSRVVLRQIRIHESVLLDALDSVASEHRVRSTRTVRRAVASFVGITVLLAAGLVTALVVFSRRVLERLQSIQEGLVAFASGEIATPIDASGDDELARVATAFNEMTAQRYRREEELRETTRQLKEAQRIAGIGSWELRLRDDRLWWSDEVFRIFGLRREEFGADFDAFFAAVHPDDREALLEVQQRALRGKESMDHTHRILRPDGSVRFVHERAELRWDGSGNREALVGTVQDVTEQRQLEDQLRASQRLEAVGRLTGGVAHDFNNLLTVILGNAELLADDLAGNEELREVARLIAETAKRGGELNRRLLAFSRRQTLSPAATDVGELLDDMGKLLRRTFSEEIEIELAYDDGLWPVYVDRAQLESAILNLALNARDAMASGGRLSMSATNVHLGPTGIDRGSELTPGDYVRITLSDTGTGIPDDVIDRVFEPFFTTKEAGKGTGMGLSMVHGFTRQSSGDVQIASEAGRGTTVTLHLPRSSESTAARPRAPEDAFRGSERILVVEDDDRVRAIVERLLRELGYRVTAVPDGRTGLEAFRTAQEDEAYDLVFTDVVLAGDMSGPELASAVRAIVPTVRIVFTSGYAPGAIAGSDPDGRSFDHLQKPYARTDLARTIREVLDR